MESSESYVNEGCAKAVIHHCIRQRHRLTYCSAQARHVSIDVREAFFWKEHF